MTILSQPYKCDGAGCEMVRENDANHWWLLWLTRDRLDRLTGEHGDGIPRRTVEIHLTPWDEGWAHQPFVKHFCGLEHALAALGCEAQKITDELVRKEKTNAA